MAGPSQAVDKYVKHAIALTQSLLQLKAALKASGRLTQDLKKQLNSAIDELNLEVLSVPTHVQSWARAEQIIKALVNRAIGPGEQLRRQIQQTLQNPVNAPPSGYTGGGGTSFSPNTPPSGSGGGAGTASVRRLVNRVISDPPPSAVIGYVEPPGETGHAPTSGHGGGPQQTGDSGSGHASGGGVDNDGSGGVEQLGGGNVDHGGSGGGSTHPWFAGPTSRASTHENAHNGYYVNFFGARSA